MRRRRLKLGDTAAITIVNVGYRSTNDWVVSAGTSRLLVDIGWPGTLGTMKAALKRVDVPLHELRYAVEPMESSPLDIEGIDLDVTMDEIVKFIAECRRYSEWVSAEPGASITPEVIERVQEKMRRVAG